MNAQRASGKPSARLAQHSTQDAQSVTMPNLSEDQEHRRLFQFTREFPTKV